MKRVQLLETREKCMFTMVGCDVNCQIYQRVQYVGSNCFSYVLKSLSCSFLLSLCKDINEDRE